MVLCMLGLQATKFWLQSIRIPIVYKYFEFLPVNLSCWKGPKGCTRQIYIYANILDRELHLNSLLREFK